MFSTFLKNKQNGVNKLELRRQTAHLLTGVLIVFLLKFQLINKEMLLGVLAGGGILSIIMRKYHAPVMLYKILLYFERPEDLQYFPGKGSFFLVAGATVATFLFQRDIAIAAISIMAVGDAITTVAGIYFGKIKNPLNASKHVEGTVLAIIFSTLAAAIFVNFEKAFLASLISMLFESLGVRHIARIIDDNLIIPLVAGAVMILTG